MSVTFFAITFTREVIKKMVSLKGDLIVKEKSIPIIFGIRNTKYIILILMLLSLITNCNNIYQQ